MPRPTRGVPFEQAVERWGDADMVAKLRSVERPRGDLPIDRLESNRYPNQSTEFVYYALEADQSLIRRLYDVEIFASGRAHGSRRMIDPDTLDPERASYNRSERFLRTTAYRLYEVEVFEAVAVPLNVREIPDWFRDLLDARDADDPKARARAAAVPLAAFRHDADYAHVWLGPLEFALTATQARIVRELHAAAVAGDPWLHLETLRERAGFASEKLSHLFHRQKDPDWRHLVRSDRRGHYRLNIRDSEADES